MKSILMTVSIVAATLALSMITTYGQTSQASQLKRRIMEQARTAVPKAPVAAPVKAEHDAEESLVPPSRFNVPRNSLAGTWDLVLTFSDGTEVPSTLQIMSGATEGDGAALHASPFSFTPPNPTLPEQGSWRYLRRNEFVASYYGYSYDEQLQPFGKIGFRHAITMARDLDHFTGEAVFEVIDLDGNVLFSDNITSAGVRQRPMAP